MTQRLFVDSITSIGAVEAADNEPSKILFWKQQTLEPVQGLIEKEGDSMPFDVESLTDEGKEYVAALQSQIEALAVEEEPSLPDDLPDIVKSRIDEMDETIEKDRVEKERLAKDLADLRDEMATEKYDARAEELAILLGDKDEVAPILKALATDSPEAFGKLDAMFDTLIVKESLAPLFKELGDVSGGGAAVDQIAAYAVEIQKDAKKEMSLVDARAQAWRDHPELKTQDREENS